MININLVLIVLFIYNVGILLIFKKPFSKQKITEATELVIEAACGDADCFHVSEKDAEYYVGKKGTAKIQEILRGLK